MTAGKQHSSNKSRRVSPAASYFSLLIIDWRVAFVMISYWVFV